MIGSDAAGLTAGGRERVSARAEMELTAGYHSPQLDVDVRLNTNESPVSPPSGLSERVAEAMATLAWNRYPDRSATALRSGLARLHGVGPEQVFAANGSNEVIQSLLLAYGGPERCAAVFEPTYALHSHIARVTGTTVVEGRRHEDLSLDLAEVERVLTGSRPTVTFLCSPNNPTGIVDPPATVAAVLEMVTDIGGLLCVDEAYGQFADHTAQSLLAPGVPLLVSRTYSKTWAMAAARLGYAIAPEWMVRNLEKVALPYHLDAVTQLAGTIALDYVEEMSARVSELVAERERMTVALAELDVEVWPSGANFVLIRPRSLPGERVWQLLVDRSILVRDCSSWPRLDGCLRVTVGTADEDDRFLAALTEVLR
ncbi:MAG: histidinol-phosphate transaminase [Acidimicrobiales bacterium]